jgi:hypothetical protein
MRGSILFLVVASLVASASITNAAPTSENDTYTPVPRTTSMPSVKPGRLTTATDFNSTNMHRAKSQHGLSDLGSSLSLSPGRQQRKSRSFTRSKLANSASSTTGQKSYYLINKLKDKLPRNTAVENWSRENFLKIKQKASAVGNYLYQYKPIKGTVDGVRNYMKPPQKRV